MPPNTQLLPLCAIFAASTAWGMHESRQPSSTLSKVGNLLQGVDLSCRSTGLPSSLHARFNRNRNYFAAQEVGGQVTLQSIQMFDSFAEDQADKIDPFWWDGYYDFLMTWENSFMKKTFGDLWTSCPVGSLSMSLFRAVMKRRVRHRGFVRNASDESLGSLLRHLQLQDWIGALLQSGWPVFSFLRLYADAFGRRGFEASTEMRHCKEVLAAAKLEHPGPGWHAPTTQALLHDAMLRPSCPCAKAVWAELAQEQLRVLQSSCPSGYFAALLTLGYRSCVAWSAVVSAKDRLAYVPSSMIVHTTILNHGSWPECPEIPLLPEEGLSRCTLLDVGANLGACSGWAASRGHAVLAVEPFPENQALWKANMRLISEDMAVRGEPSPQFHLVEAAVSSSSYSGELLCPDDPSNCKLARAKQTGSVGIAVEVKTMDMILERLEKDVLKGEGRPWPPLCALKVDVEGSELDVFQGASGLLANPSLRSVHFEFVPCGLDSHRAGTSGELLRMLRSHGFKIYESTAVAKIMEESQTLTNLGEEVVLSQLPSCKPSFALTALRL